MKQLIYFFLLILYNSCDNPIKNNQDQDCIIDLGGFYDDCGICSGGISGHEANSDSSCESSCASDMKDDCGECDVIPNSSMDLCNICFGNNTSCSKGLLTKSTWSFNSIQLWNNSSCSGAPYYEVNNQLCIIDDNQIEVCFSYIFNFSDVIYMIDELEFFIFEQVLIYDDHTESLEGLWRINNSQLCLLYEGSDVEKCYNLIDFQNTYYDCQGDDIYLCENNEVSFFTINDDEQTCSKEIFNANESDFSTKIIIPNDDIQLLPLSIQTILRYQNHLYE